MSEMFQFNLQCHNSNRSKLSLHFSQSSDFSSLASYVIPTVPTQIFTDKSFQCYFSKVHALTKFYGKKNCARKEFVIFNMCVHSQTFLFFICSFASSYLTYLHTGWYKTVSSHFFSLIKVLVTKFCGKETITTVCGFKKLY